MDNAYKQELRILILEDEPTDAELIERALRKAGLNFVAQRVATRREFVDALDRFKPDIVLSDYKLPDFDGLSAVRLVRERDAQLPIIAVSGAVGDEEAVQLIRAGADDYVLKDRLARLPSAVQRALTEAEGRRARRKAEEALHHSEEAYRGLFELSPDAIVVWDRNGVVETANQAAATLIGFDQASELVGRRWLDFVVAEDRPPRVETVRNFDHAAGANETEFSMRRRDGRRLFVQCRLRAVLDGAGKHAQTIAMVRDVTERRAAEHKIEHLALRDQLTQLSNRRLLFERLQHAVIHGPRSGRRGALLFVDLDRFKAVNETFGYDAGDELLRQVAERLGAQVDEADTLARLGADEFAVMLEDLSANLQQAAAHVENVGETILAALNQPYVITGRQLQCSSSIGATLFNIDQDTVGELLRRVDEAMRLAKAAAPGGLGFVGPET
jgi:diguanylate cyclase (GGDEF)-like protein/PAS domain S-box-containing protein